MYHEKDKSTFGETWSSLARKFNYFSSEAIRSDFKRERKRRGYTKEDKKQVINYPRIICFDVEKSPMLVYTFSLWQDGISPSNVAEDSILISWSAKIMNDAEVRSDVLIPEEAIERDDFRVCFSIWELLNTADIVIGHNVKDFDLKFLNSRFIIHGFSPLKSFQIIDTLKIARSTFGFSSNKLDFLNKTLGIKQKLENSGMKLWISCMNGDQKSLIEMDTYCKGDSLAVEELYYKFRGYITNHPNFGLYNPDKKVCPNCGSSGLDDNGFYYTSSGKYQSLKCCDCGALSRNRLSVVEKETKRNLLRN
jgi:hypothetical protein